MVYRFSIKSKIGDKMKNFNIHSALLVLVLFSFSVLMGQSENANTNDDLNSVKKINTANLYGERIFFVKKKVVSNMVLSDIYSMNPNGGDVQRLTNFSDSYYVTELPEISRDGKKLTFISNYESWKSAFYLDAFIADLGSGIFKRVTGDERPFPATNLTPIKVKVHDPHRYAVSSSAVRLSYKGCTNFIPMSADSMVIDVPADEDIWVKADFAKGKGDIEFIRVQAGAGERIDLTLGDGTISAESCSPSFNGDQIVVSVNFESPDMPFYKLGIWNDSGMPLYMENIGGHSLGGDTYPTYSPDGSMIAYATGEHTFNSLGVISTSNLTSSPTILVQGSRFGIQGFCSQPSWSPDGSEIVFVFTTINGLELQSNLYKVSVNGGDPVQLTSYSWNEIVSKPSYSPDGTKIAFNHIQNNGGGIFSLLDLINYTYTSNIYFIPSNGGQAVALTSDGVSIDPSWGVVNTTVEVHDEIQTQPSSFMLYQNYPNPFNPSTTIKYTIPRFGGQASIGTGHASISSREGKERSDRGVLVTLKIYDILGREVATLVNKEQLPGTYEVEFSSSSQHLVSGIYFYKLSAGNFIETKKMILMK